MASTYSDLKIELIGTGEQSGTWGTTTNTNLGTAIEEAITGSADVTFAGADVTLNLTDTNTTQEARNLRLNLVGSTGAARNLIVPAIEKVYIVNNACAHTITVKNSTGTGIAVPAGKTMYLYNDSTNVVDAITHLSSLTLDTDLAVADGGTGSSTAAGARTNLGLGTMATQNATAISVSGGTITGITDLAVADGGTGASTAANARTNLGLGTMATQSSNAISVTGGIITGITDLAVADGGTGASNATDARSNLAAAKSGANNDITSLSGLTTDLSVSQGGTGASNATNARINLAAAKSGSNSDITALTGLTSKTGSGNVVLQNSPGLTGVPTAPTASTGTNTTQIATTQFVTTAIANSGSITIEPTSAGVPTGGSDGDIVYQY